RRRQRRILEETRLIRLVHEVLVARVRLLDRGLDRNRVLFREREQVHPTAEALQELALLPGGDHAKVRSERGIRELEADLIVSLARGAVGDVPGVLLERDLDLALRDDRPR